MTKSLETMQSDKRNKRLCSVLSVLLVALMLFSSALFCVAARDNSWGLNVSTADGVGYFYSVGAGGYARRTWSTIRQNCFLQCKKLADTFNSSITEFYNDQNVIWILEYFYDNNAQNEAVEFGNRWNTFNKRVTDFINETALLVGYGDSVPRVNGAEVTVDQYQSLHSRLSEELKNLNALISEIKSAYSVIQSLNKSGMSGSIIDAENIVNRLWSSLSLLISSVGLGSGTVDPFLGITTSLDSIENIANTIAGVTKTFAYAIAVILFGVNITTTALQNEILTLRGGIKVFARVILVKIWIDIAIPVCMLILKIVNDLAGQILSMLAAGASNVFNSTTINNSSNSIWDPILKVINGIFNLLRDLITGFPTFLLICVMLVCIVIVIIKLVSRCFELTCLVSLSPIFFATLVGEESKRYFRRFISAFLSTAGYIAYVAIVYAVGSKWIADATSPDVRNSLLSLFLPIMATLPRAIIVIACCRVMVKPPKVLLSLTDGG